MNDVLVKSLQEMPDIASNIEISNQIRMHHMLQSLFPNANAKVLFIISELLQSESVMISTREIPCDNFDIYHKRMKNVMNKAKKSTCQVLKVGAGIWNQEAQQFEVIAHNGGLDDQIKCSLEMHELKMGCGHAEPNAFAIASRLGLRIEGMSMWVTDSPCYSCAQLNVSGGIKEVWFIRNHMNPLGIYYLLINNVKVYQLLPMKIREFILVPVSY